MYISQKNNIENNTQNGLAEFWCLRGRCLPIHNELVSFVFANSIIMGKKFGKHSRKQTHHVLLN